jgi:hypothetical protein
MRWYWVRTSFFVRETCEAALLRLGARAAVPSADLAAEIGRMQGKRDLCRNPNIGCRSIEDQRDAWQVRGLCDEIGVS